MNISGECFGGGCGSGLVINCLCSMNPLERGGAGRIFKWWKPLLSSMVAYAGPWRVMPNWADKGMTRSIVTVERVK